MLPVVATQEIAAVQGVGDPDPLAVVAADLERDCQEFCARRAVETAIRPWPCR